MIRFTALTALLCLALPSANASASDNYPQPTHWYQSHQPLTKPAQVKRSKAAKPRVARKGRVDGKKITVPFKCGPLTRYAAPGAVPRFEGFCRELYAIYPFKDYQVGFMRRGSCHQGSKHVCGGAGDFFQGCRSTGPGHCLPKDFPVAKTEELAKRWGLFPGSKWVSRDVGHFECPGKDLRCEKPIKLAALDEKDNPPPKRWPVVLASAGSEPLLNEQVAKIEGVNTPVREVPNDILRERFPPPTVHGSRFANLWDEHINLDASALFDAMYVPKPQGPQQGVIAEIRAAARAYEVPEQFLFSVVRVESSFKPYERTGSYKGLCQFSDFLWKRYDGGSGDIWNARDHAWACARKFAYERAILTEVLGRVPTFDEQYLAHQQGYGGAFAHLMQPDRLAWLNMHSTDEGRTKTRFRQFKGAAAAVAWAKAAIWGNIPTNMKARFGDVSKVTSEAFAALWKDKIDKWATIYATRPPAEPVLAAGPKKTKVAKKKGKTRYAYLKAKAKKKKAIRVASR